MDVNLFDLLWVKRVPDMISEHTDMLMSVNVASLCDSRTLYIKYIVMVGTTEDKFWCGETILCLNCKV